MPPKRQGASTRSRRPGRRSPSPAKPTVSHRRASLPRTSCDGDEDGYALPSTILPDDINDLPSFRGSRPTPRTSATVPQDLGHVTETLQSCLSKGPPRHTVSIHDVDPWLRFNVYVRRGYRPSRLSPREAILSIFLYFHNETVNIFSHLVPCVLMLYLTLYPPVTPFFWVLQQQLGHHESPPTGGGDGNPAEAAAAASAVLASRWSRGNVWGDRVAQSRAAASATAGVGDVASRGARGGPFAWFLRNPVDETVGRATASLLFPASGRGVDGGHPPAAATLASRGFESDPRPLLSLLCAAFAMTFLLSIVYHTFMPCAHTARGYRQLLQCDVVGVLSSITGSVYVYFSRGSPCVAPPMYRALSVLMWTSTLATVYALIIAPIKDELKTTLYATIRAVQYTTAELLCAGLECLRGGRPLEAPHPQSANLLRVWLWKGHCRFRLWRREGRMNVLLRDLDDDGQGGIGAEAEGDTHRYVSPQASDATAASAPMSASQRAIIVLVHCILHFVCFVLLVVPKRREHGYAEAAYYHALSYVWLVVGGAVNALRFPERWIAHLRARAYAHQMAWQAHDAQQMCLRRLEAEQRASGRHEPNLLNAEGNDEEGTSALFRLGHYLANRLGRFSLARFVTRYIISNRELDYCGNSHNIWHLCTVMSTFCMLAGAYYDCIEYELIRCA